MDSPISLFPLKIYQRSLTSYKDMYLNDWFACNFKKNIFMNIAFTLTKVS